MSKTFLAALAGMAIVALYTGEGAPKQESPAHVVASTSTTRGGSGLTIRTSCEMSGYMVAVG